MVYLTPGFNETVMPRVYDKGDVCPYSVLKCAIVAQFDSSNQNTLRACSGLVKASIFATSVASNQICEWS